MQTYLLVLTGRERASMCASASVRLVLFACLASLLGPSSARPALDATGTQALKREKRSSWNCLELGLEVAGSIKEIPPTNGPLDLPTMPRASDGRRWSHVLQIYRGENGAGERGEMTAEREIEACVGYVVEDRSLACLVQEWPTDAQYILFAERPSLSHSTTVWFECAGYQRCFQLISGEDSTKSKVLRRSAQDTLTSKHTLDKEAEEKKKNTSSWLVGVGVAVVGLVGVMATLAMCAHGSQAYEPDIPNDRASDEVASHVNEPSATKSESMVNLLNEGSSSTEQPPERMSPVESQQSGSQEPLVQSGNETAKVKGRSSKDHAELNGPTLEVADNRPAGTGSEKTEEKGEREYRGYGSVKKPETREYDYVDKTAGGETNGEEDEVGYAYATVGGAMGQGPTQPAAEPDGSIRGGGDNGGMAAQEGGKDKVAGLPPPYGKVTRHMVPMSKRADYSEVMTSSPSPMLPPGRPRAVTEPMDPSVVAPGGGGGQQQQLRSDRAFTESAAHLPLPQIPGLDPGDQTYDSIPDELRNDVDGDATTPGEGGGSSRQPIRDSLYEEVTVGEMNIVSEANLGGDEDDTYESVPEDIRHGTPTSPETLSPSSPFPPPPRSPVAPHAKLKSEGVPTSPTLKERDEEDGKRKGKDATRDGKSEQKKHKILGKAKSEAASEPRGRSLSSLFSRKKGTNPPPTSKLRILPGPLPHMSASSSSMSSPTHPSPPPIPAPPPPPQEEEEDIPPDGAYDMIDLLNPRGAALLKGTNAAKSKSASLPASMRGAGAGSPFHATIDHGPLPQLPEESAGGRVARRRIKEEMDPEYDTVVLLEQVQDDPNYDSVEVTWEVDAMPKLEPAGEEKKRRRRELEGGGPTPPVNRYARVSSHVEGVVSPELSAVSPDHDDLGYAVIPAHLKVRKRAMSDAVKKKAVGEEEEEEGDEGASARPKSVEIVDDLGYDKITKFQPRAEEEEEAEEGASPTPPKDPAYESVTDALREAQEKEKEEEEEEDSPDKKEAPYATVDMAAKRKSQFLKQMSGAASFPLDSDPDHREGKSPSPNPPPLPQQGDLGDLAEFQRPPVPLQAEASLQLIDPSEIERPSMSSSTNPYSQIDIPCDPPYASVKKKKEPESAEGGGAKREEEQTADNYEDENPYATVDNDCESETLSTVQSDPPYARIREGQVVEETESGSGPGQVEEGGGGGVSVSQNGTEQTDRGDDDEGTYDRLDHGFGNAASCRANTAAPPPLSPGREREVATVTVDFSTSPELVVTRPDGSAESEMNGVITDTEEKTINFT